MKIVFATPLSNHASTIIGRIRPLAAEFAVAGHEPHLLLVGEIESNSDAIIKEHSIGAEPFTRSDAGKKRLKGVLLIQNMLASAWNTWQKLQDLQPDVVIISKPLPSNVLGVGLWRFFNSSGLIILDTDDFELTANQLGSILQRAAVHWSERKAARLADAVAAASPLLVDHFRHLTRDALPVALVPTGLTLSSTTLASKTEHENLLYIGSVSIGSGHRVDLLPKILKEVRLKYSNAQLTIMGDGDSVQQLKREFADMNLENAVIWTGRFSADDIARKIAANSLLIDPIDSSVEVRAKSSYRVALATALGLPVVTSDVGIRPQLIPVLLHDRFFADPESSRAYATKIIDLLDRPLGDTERASLQEHASSYQWDTLSRKYLAMMKV